MVQVGNASTVPGDGLEAFATGLTGTWMTGLEPGVHRGLPSANLELIFALGAPLRLAAMPDPAQPPGAFQALAAGLHTGPAVIEYGREEHSISVALTPAGRRALLGCPPAALAGMVVDLADLLGAEAHALTERLAVAPRWDVRFELVRSWMRERASRADGTDGRHARDARGVLSHAWIRIVGSGGSVRIDDLAAELWYSRGQLTKRFAAEYGVTPKQLARIVRFASSRAALGATPRPALADVAIGCGYFDQPHMVRDWREFAGLSPGQWLDAEVLPFVQAETAGPVPGSRV